MKTHRLRPSGFSDLKLNHDTNSGLDDSTHDTGGATAHGA